MGNVSTVDTNINNLIYFNKKNIANATLIKTPKYILLITNSLKKLSDLDTEYITVKLNSFELNDNKTVSIPELSNDLKENFNYHYNVINDEKKFNELCEKYKEFTVIKLEIRITDIESRNIYYNISDQCGYKSSNIIQLANVNYNDRCILFIGEKHDNIHRKKGHCVMQIIHLITKNHLNNACLLIEHNIYDNQIVEYCEKSNITLIDIDAKTRHSLFIYDLLKYTNHVYFTDIWFLLNDIYVFLLNEQSKINDELFFMMFSTENYKDILKKDYKIFLDEILAMRVVLLKLNSDERKNISTQISEYMKENKNSSDLVKIMNPLFDLSFLYKLQLNSNYKHTICYMGGFHTPSVINIFDIIANDENKIVIDSYYSTKLNISEYYDHPIKMSEIIKFINKHYVKNKSNIIIGDGPSINYFYIICFIILSVLFILYIASYFEIFGFIQTIDSY